MARCIPDIHDHMQAAGYPPECSELDRYFAAMGRIPERVAVGARFYDRVHRNMKDHGWDVARGLKYRGAKLERYS